MKKTAVILLAVLTAGWIQAQELSVVQQAFVDGGGIPCP